MSYYTRWRTIIGTPLFQRFLQDNYALGISDLSLFKRSSSFSDPGFSCLLCGVGNEETARSFIQFVVKRNPKARIFIIDLGSEQIVAVKKLVKQYFQEYDIVVKQMNALDLKSLIKKSSLEWIETDGFLEFFAPADLKKLLNIWSFLLKHDGFITIREPASDNYLQSLVDVFRVTMGRWWLGIKIYIHTLKEFDSMFKDAGFQYVTFPTIVPTFRRFTLIKKGVEYHAKNNT